MDRTPHFPIRSETHALIERLVAFDTTSRNSNLGLIEWVRDHLRHLGVASRLTYDSSSKKANLFATIGSGERPGIVLSGHTDVVPVDGQDWHTEPFKATLKDDRYFGRGVADMKGFIGVVLGMAPKFLAAPLKAPIHFALSYDEEVGCLGVRGLIDDLARSNIKPAGCIVGEPTSMQVVVAHKGKRSYECCVKGKEAHSALTPQGVNAIEYAARLIVYIRHMADRMRDCEARDSAFDVPFTTLQTGTITGGTAVNIVPRECAFRFEFRYLPGADPEALESEIRNFAMHTLLPQMRAVDPSTSITIETSSEIPGLNMRDDDRLTYLAHALSRGRQDVTGERTGKVAYATEAGLFQVAGIPSIICGPGSIEQAHKPDEFITLEQIARCEAFMERLTEELAR
ncbi:MAG: acetylornithine deacetylase [Burkholderiales bacterium]